MDWNETPELNMKILRRVAVLLLALADLAERAGGRCLAVRWSVLWLLRPGEAIARDYALALTRGTVLIGQPTFPGNSAADAMRLAQSFRAVAAALITLLEDALTAWQEDIPLADDASLALLTTRALALADRPPAVAICDTSRRSTSLSCTTRPSFRGRTAEPGIQNGEG